ncbi:5-carboxymethyl-2-hydroxymuconate Delta-isomerase [Lentzea jiangxiensis]|uniref:5-carboxymethyl-2-hydroxymuconate isomerase n=1 Tax=Lentzea jiangxiensis TaxID=641025 RepID=A0A1H0WAH2_9PSEU|nr:hypothetical protein [Lentzea jiangxiensis]SDP87704.1 5-carboxymethyl-2-hydroxymuconate isomerase [Lentzea jiangxiensis]
MPQITVEYSPELRGAFDRRGFAIALHNALSPLVSADVAEFKTRFRQIEEIVVGDGSPVAIVHVRVGLLTGRPVELKQQVGQAGVDLLRDHLKPVEGVPAQVSLEVYDLDREQYRKLVL